MKKCLRGAGKSIKILTQNKNLDETENEFITADPDTSGLKGPPSIEEIRKYSQNYFILWSSRKRWILRSKQTLVQHNRDIQTFINSYDIDFNFVKDLTGMPHNPSEDLWLPLEPIKKGDSLAPEVTGEWKDKGCLVTRRENTRVALYIILGYLFEHGFELDRLEPAEVDEMYYLLLNGKPLTKGCQMQLQETDLLQKLTDKRETKEGLGHKDISKIQTLKGCLDNAEFHELVWQFFDCYPLTVSIPPQQSTFRTTLELTISDINSMGFRERLLRSILTGFICPRVKLFFDGGRLKNLDSICTILAPSESRIIRIDLRPESNLIRIKKSSSQATFYFPSAEDIPLREEDPNKSNTLNHADPSSAEVFMNTRRGYFAFPAFFISLFCCVFSLSFLYFISNILYLKPQDLMTKDLKEVGGLISTLIAVIPSVSIVLLLLRDEHEMNSISLGIPRLILIINLIALIFFNLSIIGGVYLCPNQEAWICLSEMDFQLLNISPSMFFTPISLLNYQAFCLTYFFGTIISSSIYANIRTVKSRRIILVTSIVTFGLSLLTITTFIHPYNYKTASLTFLLLTLLLTLFLLIFVCVYSCRGSRSHLLGSP